MNTMREHDFWRLIKRAQQEKRQHASSRDELRRRYGFADSRETAFHLGRLLRPRSLIEIVRFQNTLRRIHWRGYRQDLWAAFGIALGGADELQFCEAISWLILKGKRA